MFQNCSVVICVSWNRRSFHHRSRKDLNLYILYYCTAQCIVVYCFLYCKNIVMMYSSKKNNEYNSKSQAQTFSYFSKHDPA